MVGQRALPAPSSGLGLGSLTPASDEREAAERFLRRHAAPPDSLFEPRRGGAAAQSCSDAAHHHRLRGARHLEANRPAAAVSALRQATELNPGDAAAHHLLGLALLRSGRCSEATVSLRLSAALQDSPATQCDLGVALHRQGLDDEAIAAYRRAIELAAEIAPELAPELAPALAEAHASLGDLLQSAGEDEDAAAAFRASAAAAPGTPRSRLNFAKALILENRFVEAAAELQQGLLLDPGDDLLHKFLGDAFARQGRFEQAVASFDRSLSFNPRQVAAHFAAAEARRFTATDRPRLARMRAALEQPGLDDQDRVMLHFAIGKALDDLGEYREAMAHFDTAHRIENDGERPAGKFDGAAFSADIDRLIRRFNPEFWAGRRGFGRDDDTPLLIVGMPRSGTTLVEQIVSSHPSIAAGGELPFWVKRAASWGGIEASHLTEREAHDTSAAYLSLLRRIAPDAARVTDKLPFNLLCLGLIHLMLPKARIIQCRRHPVDTCLSMYFTRFRQTVRFASDKADLAVAYRHYARLMDHWLSALPPDRLLQVEYEELIADREAATRRVIAFAGLGWDDACLYPEHNRRAVTTASLWQARQPVYRTSVERWRHYEPWIGELRRLLPGQAADGRVSTQSSGPAA